MKTQLPYLLLALLFGGYVFLSTCTSPVHDELLDSVNMALSPDARGSDVERRIQSLQQLPTSSHSEEQFIEVLTTVLRAQQLASAEDSIQASTERLFKQADSLAQHIDHHALRIWTNTQIGYYYYRMTRLEQAFPYFLQSSKQLLKRPLHALIDAPGCLLKNAYFFGNIGDHRTAIHLLSEILAQPDTASIDYATTHFALGVEYLAVADYARAEHHFETSRDLSAHTDHIRHAKALGELAGLAERKGAYQQAEELLLQDILLSEKYGDNRNKMYAQIKLARLYQKQQKWETAQSLLHDAKAYTADKPNLTGFTKEITLLELQLAARSDDAARQLELHRQLRVLDEQLKHRDGNDAVMKVNLDLQRERAAWQQVSHHSKLREARLIGAALVVICGLLLAVALSIRLSKIRALKLQKMAFENKITKIQLEKVASESRYLKAQETLQSYRTFLDERNKAIDMLKTEVGKLQQSNSNDFGQQQHELQQLLSEHLMTDENWIKFKRTFAREYPEHLEQVKQQLADITESQLRIVLLQKIGLRNQEMANLLGVSHESIKKARQRLRKKYGEGYDLAAVPVHQQQETSYPENER